jgi:ATP-dependent RNA helicase DeaD
MVNNARVAGFKQKITDTLAAGDLAFMQSLVEQYQREHDVPALEVAAALAKLTLGDQPLLLKPEPRERERQGRDTEPRDRQSRGRQGRDSGFKQLHRIDRSERSRKPPAEDTERYRIEVGRADGIEPGNIVGAIANEAGIDGKHIGPISIEESFSTVDLPAGMPREIFKHLKKVWIRGKQLRISRIGDEPERPGKPYVKGQPKKPPAGKRSSGKSSASKSSAKRPPAKKLHRKGPKKDPG